jgi:hypothetical protein
VYEVRRTLLVALGCSLTTACVLALDGLSGGSAGPEADGGGTDAGVADRGNGAVDSTGPGQQDAASDGPAPPSPCLVPHLFCDDFDDSGVPNAGWDSVTDGGVLQLDRSAAVSPPASFEVILPAPGGTSSSASMRKRFTVPNGKLHLELDVRAEEPFLNGNFGEFDLVQIALPDYKADAGAVMDLDIYPTERTFELYVGDLTSSNGTSTKKVLDFPAQRWAHVMVDVAMGGSSPTATITVDGVVTAVPLPGPVYSSAVVNIGAPYFNKVNDTRTIHIDNIVVDAP